MELVLPMTRAADDAEFERLMCAHERQVLGVALRLTGNLADAQDVAQEVFLRLHRSRSWLGEDVGGWLYRVTVNVCSVALVSLQTCSTGARRYIACERCSQRPARPPTGSTRGTSSSRMSPGPASRSRSTTRSTSSKRETGPMGTSTGLRRCSRRSTTCALAILPCDASGVPSFLSSCLPQLPGEG